MVGPAAGLCQARRMLTASGAAVAAPFQTVMAALCVATREGMKEQ